MAADKEEIILEFKIDQADAITELERTKKSIIQIKQEQKELNDAYKKGSITIDEFSAESVRLEAILKKQQNTYNQVQKSVTGVKTQLDKLIDSNKKISKDLGETAKKFQEVAGNINVAGVNVGSLTSKLASFANPATAAVTIVGALGAAYARSTIGAKDLEFAQNQLSTAITITTNRFAGLISSAEDGEGLFSRLTAGALAYLDPTTGALSRLAAFNIEKLEDLGRDEIEIRSKISDRLADNQEKLTQIAEAETKIVDKVRLSNEIIENLKTNRSELTDVLQKELKILQDNLKIDENNEATQTAILQKQREINKLNADTEKRIQGQQRALDNILDAEEKRLKAERDLIRESNKTGLFSDNTFTTPQSAQQFEAGIAQSNLNATDQAKLNSAKYLDNALAEIAKQKADRDTKQAGEEFRLQKTVDQAKLQSAQLVANGLANLADEGSEAQKAFALTAIAADTARAVTGGIAAAQDVPFPGNLVAMATVIATILSNIAQAKSIAGFAEGGWTGPGDKYKPVGIVHADEYVTPKHIVHSAAAQPHLAALERMRLRGYADGGLVTNSLTSETNNALLLSNVFKNMPPVIAEVREIANGMRKLQLKEAISKGAPFK